MQQTAWTELDVRLALTASPSRCVVQSAELKPAVLLKPPFSVRRAVGAQGTYTVSITIALQDAADEDKRSVTAAYSVEVGAAAAAAGGGGGAQRLQFVSQVVSYAAPAEPSLKRPRLE